MIIGVGNEAIRHASRELNNWGKWGADDQVGTLNYVQPEDIVRAASMIRTGKVFALGLALNSGTQQTGFVCGFSDSIRTSLTTGVKKAEQANDTMALRYARSIIDMPLQVGTHWDALGHLSVGERMYNGYDVAQAGPQGLGKLGIEHTRQKMVGRGVLLDIARCKGVEYLEDGYGISNDDLNHCAKEENVEIRRGDFVIIRTGQMERYLKEGRWSADRRKDTPGLKFETCYWCHEKQIAAVSADTSSVEVRPNEINNVMQPWHWVVIPAMGLTVGDMFFVKDLADDCDADGTYEFFFCAPPLRITGGSGSPVNPQAIK